MFKKLLAVLVVALALGSAACSDDPIPPQLGIAHIEKETEGKVVGYFVQKADLLSNGMIYAVVCRKGLIHTAVLSGSVLEPKLSYKDETIGYCGTGADLYSRYAVSLRENRMANEQFPEKHIQDNIAGIEAAMAALEAAIK